MSNSKYPHCQLSMQRSIAPSSKWFWKVTMPDGQLYEASKGPLSFEDCVADMHLRGTTALDAADVIWRRNPAPIIAEQEKADAVFWGVGTKPDSLSRAASFCSSFNCFNALTIPFCMRCSRRLRDSRARVDSV